MQEHSVSEPKVLEQGRRVANNLAEAAAASVARSFTARMRGGVGEGLWRQAVGVNYNHEWRVATQTAHTLVLLWGALTLSLLEGSVRGSALSGTSSRQCLCLGWALWLVRPPVDCLNLRALVDICCHWPRACFGLVKPCTKCRPHIRWWCGCRSGAAVGGTNKGREMAHS